MVLRFVLQTVAVALALALATWLIPGVRATSTGAVALSALLLGVANAGVRPLLRFALHPVTVPYVILMVLLVNVLAMLLGPALTMRWSFDSFAAAAATVLLVSAVSVIVAIVPLTRGDRALAWGLNEPKTPGAGPVDRHPQLDEEPSTAH